MGIVNFFESFISRFSPFSSAANSWPSGHEESQGDFQESRSEIKWHIFSFGVPCMYPSFWALYRIDDLVQINPRPECFWHRWMDLDMRSNHFWRPSNGFHGMEDVQLTRTIVFLKHCLYQLSGGIRGFISIIKVDSIIK